MAAAECAHHFAAGSWVRRADGRLAERWMRLVRAPSGHVNWAATRWALTTLGISLGSTVTAAHAPSCAQERYCSSGRLVVFKARYRVWWESQPAMMSYLRIR